MAFLLLLSLAGFAGLYLHLGAGFVGFTQVLVYIGGILVLFLFGVMLTRSADLAVRRKWRAGILLPAVAAGVITLAGLTYVAVACPWGQGKAAGGGVPPSTEEIGIQLMSRYILPFEVVSVLLLVAMVGATFVARGSISDGGSEAHRGEGG
jgi:NADH-quinone oxidoreductase subunit J